MIIVQFILLIFKIIFIMLLQLSQFSSLCPPPPSTPHSLRQSSHNYSCPWVICVSSLATPFPTVCFTSPWLFCNYLFVLLHPFTISPIPLSAPLPSDNHQNALCIHDSVSVFVCLVVFRFNCW